MTMHMPACMACCAQLCKQPRPCWLAYPAALCKTGNCSAAQQPLQSGLITFSAGVLASCPQSHRRGLGGKLWSACGQGGHGTLSADLPPKLRHHDQAQHHVHKSGAYAAGLSTATCCLASRPRLCLCAGYEICDAPGELTCQRHWAPVRAGV